MESFAEKLQSLRKGRGLSQENLAEELGVSRQAVSKWESGQSLPELEKLIAISRLFGVTIDSLVNGPGSVPPPEPAASGERVYFTLPSSSREYEYKSSRTLWGLPLVHIHTGRGLYRAKGIFAIGNVACGIVSIGLASAGIVSLGVVSAGFLAFGVLAAGLLAFGSVAAGGIAMGGIAVGLLAAGGLSVGMVSMGGCAIASHIAVGGYANGHIAIGDVAQGIKTLHIGDGKFEVVSAQQVETLIRGEFPNMWNPLVRFVAGFFRS